MRKILIFTFLGICCVAEKLKIPERVIHCYRGNLTEPWSPQTLSNIIGIIRKIEIQRSTGSDLRHLSARLFHDFRIDGIQQFPYLETEEVIPYSRSGFMAYKNIILRRLVSNVPGEIDYENILTPFEFCSLHKALSSTVEPFERKDELRHCPKSILNGTRKYEPPISMVPRPRDPSVHHRHPHGNFTVLHPTFSRCPIESGVVAVNSKTESANNVHPGVLIANIAAGLQPQQVKIGDFVAAMRTKSLYENVETMEINDSRQKISKLLSSLSSVDNTYATGLVGDLAEVVLYQGASGNFSIGFDGKWNDTNFPRLFHMNGNRRGLWHLTDTEILSGIDGIFFSQQVSAWTSRIRRLRLSQVLEMFYLHQGIEIPLTETTSGRKIYTGRTWKKTEKKNELDDDQSTDLSAFDGRKIFKKFDFSNTKSELIDVDLKYLSRMSITTDVSKVCHRKRIIELIDVNKLKEETVNFIQLLEMEVAQPLISTGLLKSYSNQVVDSMMDYARRLVSSSDSTPNCRQNPLNYKRTSVDLTIIIDGSRNAYENLQLIHSVADIIDVSHFGSYISVIHGSTGQYLVNRTNSLSNLYEQWRNSSSVPNPIRLSLSNSFGSFMFQLVDQMMNDKETGIRGGLAKVCLVVSQLHRISEMDFDSARSILSGSMKQFPDLYFMFLTDDVNTFKEMVEKRNISDSPILNDDNERYRFIETNSVAFSSFGASLSEGLGSIPKKIISPYCKRSENDRRTWDDVMKRDEFDEYITPNEETRYRISSAYLLNTGEVRVKFQNAGYGDFTVCMSRTSNMQWPRCQSVVDIGYVWFNITNPCPLSEQSHCSHIYFSLGVDTTYLKCSEDDCRFPFDVRIQIRPEGLRCERNDSRQYILSFKMLIPTYLMVFAAFFRLRII